MRKRALLSVLLLVACTAHRSDEPVGSVSAAASPAITEVASFGANPGAIKMYEHVPAKLAASPGLVVVLHGCTEGAADASSRYGFDTVADENGFVVVYPEQTTANNQARCFNWGGVYGDMSTLERGKGENGSIKSMVDKAIATHGVDPKKVFVAGFSAGGAEALVVAAAWPDVFAGAASIAGVPYRCPTSFADVFTCQNPGKDQTPEKWGDAVRTAGKGFAGPWPRVAIWQGTTDSVVGPKNRTEAIEQWANVHGVDPKAPSVTDKVDGQDHTAWKNAAGAIVVESYSIAGMGHGIPVVPGAQCGTAGQYALDKGICAARHIASFFGLAATMSGDGGASSSGDASSGGTSSGGASSSSSSSSTAGGPPGSSNGGPGGNGADPSEGNYGSTCSMGVASSRSAWGVFVLAFAALAIARRARRGA